MSARRPAALLIAGPTASGKSAVAVAVARKLGSPVVNADSMQVYGDLRVLTARPTPEDEAAAPHVLFGHVDAALNYSVGRYLADAGRVLAHEREQGRLPILVGGTGLYFKALTQGLSAIPDVPEDIRAQVRATAQGLAAADLHARLAACDPLMAARLRPSDPQRILRALEVLEATGESLATFQGARTPPLLDPRDCIAVFLEPERAELRARIDARFDAMMRGGAVPEAAALAARHLDPALPVMRAHGVPGLVAYLRGEMSLQAAIEKGKTDTRRYARRQHTFARRQLPQFAWIPPERAEEELLARLALFGEEAQTPRYVS